MKHIKHWLITAVVLLYSVTVSAGAYFEVDGIWYETNDNSELTVDVIAPRDGSNYSGNVEIPSRVEYNAVSWKINSVKGFTACPDLISVSIPNTVWYVYSAFNGSSNLESITCNAVNPPVANEYTFNGVNKETCTIYVPASSVDAYKGADGWSEFTNIQPILIASGTFPNNVNWKLTDEGQLIIEGVGEMTRTPWRFEYESFIKSVTIGEGVTSIADMAFYGCSNLTTITIPESVTSIEKTAFYKCSSLTSITIPETITRIEENTFCGCSSLTSFTIPERVTSIGEYAFAGCSSLTSITIPESVISIGKGAFCGCSNLTSITIPKCVTSIGYQVFADCCNLSIITFSENSQLKSIGERAFLGCSSLSSIAIPSGVTSIGSNAFESCSSLTSIVIPEDVTSIENSTFYGCSNLTSITIPSGVTSIGSNAFYNCSSLTLIVIPEDVTSIGHSAFSGCSTLTSITIPDGVTSIENSTFSGCSKLTSTIFSENSHLTSIGESAFSGCRSLTCIIIPDGVTSIGKYAFKDCRSFTSVTIPENVKSLGTSIFYYCEELTSITCEALIPPTSENASPFGYIEETIPVYVPASSVDAYKSSVTWKRFTNIQPIASDILATSLTLDVIEVTLSTSETSTLIATLLPAEVTNPELAWASSNEAVVTVNSEGIVTAVGAGEAVVTVRTTDGSNLSATCVVSVATVDDDVKEYENTLLVDDLDARAGTQVELSIALKNNVNITNFQFDLVLPEGITIAQDEDGYDLIDLSTARTTARKHTIGNELQNDGSMRVICYSSSNAVFSGTEGEVMTIKLNMSKSLSEGEYSVQLKNLVLTEYTDGSAIKHTIPCIESKINVYVYTPGDVNDDGSIDVTDISGVVNFILNTATDGLIERAADVNEDGAVDVTDISGVVNMILNVSASKTSFSRGLLRTSVVESTDDIRMTVLPFTLEAGEEKEVQILLDNPNDAFTGVQFDLYLPEGVSVAMDDEGYYYVDLGSRTNNRNHVLPECSLLEDGGLRVVCYSNSNKTFKNEEGDILVLTIVGDENLSEGVCELSIENIVLSRPDVTNNKPSDYVASILSGDGGAIPALALHGVYTADVLDDFSTALATNKIVTSIDLTEAVSVDDSGVLTTGNPNTLIYLSENEVLANESNVVCGDKCDNLVLIDGYAFSTPVSFEALQATYTRTLSNMKWNALYLPFDISVDALENCDIASFTTMNLHDDNSVTMTATINEEGTLHANTACLIRMKSGVEELCITENNVTVWAEQNTESYTNGSKKASVTGVYSEILVSDKTFLDNKI